MRLHTNLAKIWTKVKCQVFMAHPVLAVTLLATYFIRNYNNNQIWYHRLIGYQHGNQLL